MWIQCSWVSFPYQGCPSRASHSPIWAGRLANRATVAGPSIRWTLIHISNAPHSLAWLLYHVGQANTHVCLKTSKYLHILCPFGRECSNKHFLNLGIAKKWHVVASALTAKCSPKKVPIISTKIARNYWGFTHLSIWSVVLLQCYTLCGVTHHL